MNFWTKSPKSKYIWLDMSQLILTKLTVLISKKGRIQFRPKLAKL